MKYQEALEKWAHYEVDTGGRRCPISNEIVSETYTDHSRGGYDDGSFRVVLFNACRHCGDSNFTIGGFLHKLNEQRKKENGKP